MDAESIKDLFQSYGPVRLKSMFGGKGIYSGDLIIGLEAFGEIWLKVDEVNKPDFVAAGSRPFTYDKKKGGEVVAMSYWRLPDAALDDPDEVKRWAQSAEAAARRAAEKKKR